MVGRIFSYLLLRLFHCTAKQNVFLESKPRYEIPDGLRGLALPVVVLYHILESLLVLALLALAVSACGASVPAGAGRDEVDMGYGKVSDNSRSFWWTASSTRPSRTCVRRRSIPSASFRTERPLPTVPVGRTESSCSRQNSLMKRKTSRCDMDCLFQ